MAEKSATCHRSEAPHICALPHIFCEFYEFILTDFSVVGSTVCPISANLFYKHSPVTFVPYSNMVDNIRDV